MTVHEFCRMMLIEAQFRASMADVRARGLSKGQAALHALLVIEPTKDAVAHWQAMERAAQTAAEWAPPSVMELLLALRMQASTNRHGEPCFCATLSVDVHEARCIAGRDALRRADMMEDKGSET